MNLITIRDLHFRFADKELLKGIHFTLRSSDHVGIIGRNGSGKTTLFRLIQKELTQERGIVSLASGLKTAHLSQMSQNESRTVYDYCLDAFRDALDLEARLHKIAEELKIDPHCEILLREYEQSFARFEHLNGYSIYSKVRGILSGLGFTEDDAQKNISLLSGGEKEDWS